MNRQSSKNSILTEHACKISVIIPMYNCASFAKEILSQMQNQTLKEIEILAIDDGSTDQTGAIVLDYTKKDPRIRYIYKQNGGAGTARNRGLCEAKGKYVLCADADEQYFPAMLETLYHTAETYNADMVYCAFFDHYIKENVEYDSPSLKVSRIPIKKALNSHTQPKLATSINYGPSNKLYLRDFIQKENLQYSTTKSGNDIFFAMAAILSARRVVYEPSRLLRIQREINPNSITSSRTKHLEGSVEAFLQLLSWAKEKELEPELLEEICERAGGVIGYNSKFAYNETFVKRIEQLLLTQPFNTMSANKKRNMLNVNLRSIHKNLAKAKENYNNVPDSDPQKEILCMKMQHWQNKLQHYQKIDQFIKTTMTPKEKLKEYIRTLFNFLISSK